MSYLGLLSAADSWNSSKLPHRSWKQLRCHRTCAGQQRVCVCVCVSLVWIHLKELQGTVYVPACFSICVLCPFTYLYMWMSVFIYCSHCVHWPAWCCICMCVCVCVCVWVCCKLSCFWHYTMIDVQGVLWAPLLHLSLSISLLPLPSLWLYMGFPVIQSLEYHGSFFR